MANALKVRALLLGEARSSLKDSSILCLSIIIPTYNEAANITKLLDSVRKNLADSVPYELIVVDDDSPDGTGKIVENYIVNESSKSQGSPIVRVIHRLRRDGLISALLSGIESSEGRFILIMDADFSPPAGSLPAILKELKKHPNSVVVASRYVSGATITGWPYRRRITGTIGNFIARYSLRLRPVKDPISGYFAFPRSLSQQIRFETKGYSSC